MHVRYQQSLQVNRVKSQKPDGQEERRPASNSEILTFRIKSTENTLLRKNYHETTQSKAIEAETTQLVKTTLTVL